jgi:hypothetical protein
MEPRRDEPQDPKPRPEKKRRRFRIVKLEERIAPRVGHGDSKGVATCDCTGGHGCSTECTTLSIE